MNLLLYRATVDDFYILLVVLHRQERELQWYFRQGGLNFSHGTTDEAGSPDEEDIAEKGVEAKNSPDEEKTPQ